MSKFAKITLLALAAFLVLGFLITANAAPPWLEDREQSLVSAPLWGNFSTCNVTNISDRTIQVTFTVTDTGGREESDGPYPLSPGGMGAAPFNLEGSVHICEISWLGQPGDVRAAYCRYSDVSHTYDPACIELY